jgi:hypothetical protein
MVGEGKEGERRELLGVLVWLVVEKGTEEEVLVAVRAVRFARAVRNSQQSPPLSSPRSIPILAEAISFLFYRAAFLLTNVNMGQ